LQNCVYHKTRITVNSSPDKLQERLLRSSPPRIKAIPKGGGGSYYAGGRDKQSFYVSALEYSAEFYHAFDLDLRSVWISEVI